MNQLIEKRLPVVRLIIDSYVNAFYPFIQREEWLLSPLVGSNNNNIWFSFVYNVFNSLYNRCTGSPITLK